MMVKYSCDTCIWFDSAHLSLKDVPNNYGYCRKHKPVIYQRENFYYGAWPLVDKLDLCGEWVKDTGIDYGLPK